MNNSLKNLSVTFLFSSFLILATQAKANSLNLSYSRFVSNNNDSIFTGSSLEVTGGGNIYAVDGFNNTLQVLNPTTQFFSSNNDLSSLSSNDAQFRWTKTLSIDTTGNIERSNQIISSGSNNVYVVDGINNQLQASTFSNGNVYVVDGINNNINSQAFENESNYSWDWSSNSQSNQGLNFFAAIFGNPQSFNGQFNVPNGFIPNNNGQINQAISGGVPTLFDGFNNNNNWLNNFNFNDFNQSTNISLNDVKNIYIIDGINNKIQLFDSSQNGIGNVYLINGINSTLQILPSNPVAVPEPNTILGALLFGAGTRFFRRIVNGQKQANKNG